MTQITFQQENGSSQALNVSLPQTTSNYATLMGVSLPQFDNVGPTFDNTEIAWEVGGVGATGTCPSGLYLSLTDLVTAINVETAGVMTFAVTAGNHCTVIATAGATDLTPSFLTRMLGFRDAQLDGVVLPVAPAAVLEATDLPNLFPISNVLVSCNRIQPTQYVKANDGRADMLGFLSLPVQGWDLLFPLSTSYDNQSLMPDLALSTSTIPGVWQFTYWAVSMFDSERYQIDFGANLPSISLLFQ